ncbi:MAG: ABC transporter substrate-binding protein [Chloroflexota bacterium]
MLQRRSSLLTRVVTLLMASLLLLAGCTPAPSAPAAPGGPSAGPAAGAVVPGAPVVGGRLIVGAISDAKVLNPVLSSDVPSAEVWSRVYESLIRVDPESGQPQPRLAERFEVAPDGTQLTFTLKPGVVWSDGTAFSGDDFKMTAEAVMRSKKSVRKNLFQDIVGARAYAEGKATEIAGITVDGNVLTIKLEKPFCPALTELGLFGIIPRHVFGKYLDPADATKNIDEAPENNAPVVGTGPFVFSEWLQNDRIVLKKNARFSFGGPYLDEWVYKVHPDATAMAAALKTGEIDAARVDPKAMDDLKQQDNLAFFSYLSPGYTYIGWNQLRGGKEFLQNRTIRQALAYGLDTQAVIDSVLLGQGQKVYAHTPPVSWAYDPSSLQEYPYDPAKAREMIEAEGYTAGADGIYQKDGQRLALTMMTNSGNKTREALLQVATEQYRQIGVEVTPLTESFEALSDRVGKGRDATYGEQGGRDYDAVILGWGMGVDPDAYGTWHSSQVKSGQNQTGYQNAEVDKALETGRTSCGQAERMAAYKTFNQKLSEDQPYNFGFAAKTLLFVNKKFQNVQPGPFPNVQNSYLWNVEQWWIKS